MTKMDKLKQIFTLESVELAEKIDTIEFIKGSVAAFIFGLIGTIPWILLSLVGFIASIFGFVIALAALKGFILGAGKLHKSALVVVVLVVLFAVPFAEIFLWFTSGLSEGFSVIDTLTLLPVVIADNIGPTLLNIGLGYVFAFIGAWKVIRG